jgi:iron complex transport system permease protein
VSRREVVLVPALLATILALSFLSIMVGKVWLGWDVWFNDANLAQRAIFLELRLPRALLGIVVGAALGLSGAALQGYLRNPLADPGIVGISGMAGLGAVLSIYFGFGALSPWALPLTAVVGAIAGVALIFGFAGVTASVVTFVLAGIILSALASAAIALLLSLAPNPWAASEIIQWLMGALTDRSFDELNFSAPLIAAGAAAVLTCRSSLDALTLGESGARSLGINLNRTQWQLAAGVGLAVGASVAVTGIISFVGLVVPHLLRPFVGSKPGALLIPSALGGAALVLAGDIAVRLIPGGTELKLGVAMSFIGAPFFLALLMSMRRKLA